MFKHFDDGAYEAVAIFDELAIPIESESLEEETEARLNENFIAVKAE